MGEKQCKAANAMCLTKKNMLFTFNFNFVPFNCFVGTLLIHYCDYLSANHFYQETILTAKQTCTTEENIKQLLKKTVFTEVTHLDGAALLSRMKEIPKRLSKQIKSFS